MQCCYCRWSLIAGRLPGRTANDVKNYWNTHLLKKFSPSTKHSKQKVHNPRDKNPLKHPINGNHNVVIIKPWPWNFHTKSFKRFGHKSDNDSSSNNNNKNYDVATSSNNKLREGDSSTFKSYYSDNDEIMWWENLLMNYNFEVDEQHQGEGDGCFNNDDNKASGILGQGDHAAMLNGGDDEETLGAREISNMFDEVNKSIGCWDQIFCDVELWNLLGSGFR